MLGAALGWVVGGSELVHRLVTPVFEFSKFILPTVFLPLAILAFGVSDLNVFVLTGLVPFWFAAGAAANLRRGRQEEEVEPIAMTVDRLVTFARVSLLIAVLMLARAELSTGGIGLGHLGWQATTFFHRDVTYLAYFTLALIGFGFDVAIRSIGSAATRRLAPSI